MYSKAEVDSEKSFWPAAELNVSGTTFITLLNNPSTLSPPEKNRIISSLSTSASAHSRWKTFREFQFSFKYTDNSKLKNIELYCKLKPRLKAIRAKSSPWHGVRTEHTLNEHPQQNQMNFIASYSNILAQQHHLILKYCNIKCFSAISFIFNWLCFQSDLQYAADRCVAC